MKLTLEFEDMTLLLDHLTIPSECSLNLIAYQERGSLLSVTPRVETALSRVLRPYFKSHPPKLIAITVLQKDPSPYATISIPKITCSSCGAIHWRITLFDKASTASWTYFLTLSILAPPSFSYAVTTFLQHADSRFAVLYFCQSATHQPRDIPPYHYHRGYALHDTAPP